MGQPSLDPSWNHLLGANCVRRIIPVATAPGWVNWTQSGGSTDTQSSNKEDTVCKLIDFPEAFAKNTEPIVVIGIASFKFHEDNLLAPGLKAYTRNGLNTGFELCLNKSQGTLVESVGVFWLALPE